MGFFKKETRDEQLEKLKKALKQCESTSEKEYKNSLYYLRIIEKSVKQACDSIENCKDAMLQHRVNDPELIETIQKQLLGVQNAFQNAVEKTKRDVEYKRNHLNKFNVTLFGKTKAGKSTLKEILTQGNGSSIGHGAQRTTRDVRSYDWNGLRVTDVPGIDAYEGKDDDAIAENAAIYADLILFMITSGQPGSDEADWLVKLKRKDKPILCVCNYRQSLTGEKRLQHYLANPEKIKEKMNVNGIVAQFNEFVAEKLPNEKIRVIVTHLMAKYLSMHLNPPDAETSKILSRMSRFTDVENALIKEITSNGIFYRTKCYLSIIDNPLYEQMRQLLDFSAMTLYQYKVITDKINQFESWAEEFNESDFEDLQNNIGNIFYRVQNTVAGFVESYLERDDLDDLWKKHLEKLKTEDEIKNTVKKYYTEAENYVQSLFKDLGTELKLIFNFNTGKLGTYSITNWKRGLGWASAVGGAGAAIVGFILGASNPVGWVIGGIAAVVGIISWFTDSREKKLREQRNKLTNKLKQSLDKMQSKALEGITKDFENNIVNGLQTTVRNKLHMLRKSMLTLANTERELALGYCRKHTEISLALVKSIIEQSEGFRDYAVHIKKVARIPSKFTVVIVDQIYDGDIHSLCNYIGSKLGCKEKVWIISLKLRQSKINLINNLLNIFHIDINGQYSEENRLTYIPKRNYPEYIKDDINIIEQITEIHLIQRG